MADLWQQLGDVGWASEGFAPVFFPIKSIETSYEHDQADHKFYGVDGADIESTGLAPVSFTVTIPFINNIVPGPAERWAQPLYPGEFRNFVSATQRSERGVLYHPEFGDVLCRVKSVRFSHNANERGGVTVTAVFRQTLPEDFAQIQLTFGASPVVLAVDAADNLDASETDYRDLVPQLPTHERDFGDFARELQAFGDSISGAIDGVQAPFKRMQAQIGRALAAFDRVGDKVEGIVRGTPKAIVKGDPEAKMRSVLSHQARAAARRLQVTVADAEKFTSQDRARNVRVFVVARPTPLASVASGLGVPMGDILTLNPRLARSPEVPGASVVRYYGARVA